MYVPAVVADKLISPELELSANAEFAQEKIPPELKPATVVGIGFGPFKHTGELYENEVVGIVCALTTIAVVLLLEL